MKDLLKILPMYGVMFLAQFIMSWGSYTFIFSRVKSGKYILPLFGEFSSWQTFTVVAWLMASILYIPGTILVVWAVRMSLKNSGSMYPWAIAGQMVPIFITMFFMWYRIGEVPNRNGWISIVLVITASIFAAFSGKS